MRAVASNKRRNNAIGGKDQVHADNRDHQLDDGTFGIQASRLTDDKKKNTLVKPTLTTGKDSQMTRSRVVNPQRVTTKR